MATVLDDTAKQFILNHMNDDHEQHLLLYCNKLKDLKQLYGADVQEATTAKIVDVNETGFEIDAVLKTSGEDKQVQIHFDFPRRAEQRLDVRVMLVEMVKTAEAI